MFTYGSHYADHRGAMLTFLKRYLLGHPNTKEPSSAMAQFIFFGMPYSNQLFKTETVHCSLKHKTNNQHHIPAMPGTSTG